MAGSDKVDPAIPCLLSMAYVDHPGAKRRGDDGCPGFQSFQKMLARDLDINVAGAICILRRRFGVIRKMRVLTS
jgi:hypothetical protein